MEPLNSPEAPAAWPALSLGERRVLGVMVEKAKTTPDVYPLSVNALNSGCNQKNNRDPIMDMSEEDVETSLAEAQKKGLAIKITGGRVVRWRHALYEAFVVDKIGLAILGELLLRGPQTEGELRGRAGRMEPIADLDALRAALRPLEERKLVVYLSAADKRGAMLTHGFHDAQELARLRATHGSHVEAAPQPMRPPVVGAPAGLETRVERLERELAELREVVQSLKTQLGG